MIRSLAGRGLACLAVLGLLLPWAAPLRAQFSADSCLAVEQQEVKAGGTSGVRFVVSGDLDGDLDIDLVTASAGDDRIAWFENLPGTVFERTDISTDADGATAVFIADINGDGALDVLSASANDNKIAWYRNNGEPEPKFSEFEISTDAALAQAVFAADIDGDGDMDVLSASFSDNKIAWYENDGDDPPDFTKTETDDDGNTVNVYEHVVSTTALGATAVYAADLDDDGDMDILSASILDDNLAWYEQVISGVPAEISWIEHVITPVDDVSFGTRPVSVVAADLDGDCPLDPDAPPGPPCMDVVVAFNGNGIDTGKIVWFRNDGMATPGFEPNEIKTELRDARQVFVADVDDDGNLDVLSAYEDTITWFQNDGAELPGFTANEVTTGLPGAMSVHAAHLDDDGNLDIQSASSIPGVRISDDKILWYRNDGLAPPGFTQEAPISLNAATPESIVIADIDDDCAPDEENPGAPCMDVVSASSADNTVAWYRNGGQTPLPVFTQDEIDTNAPGVLSVAVADLSGNCDSGPTPPPGNPCLDVIAAVPGDGITGKIVWYANDGTFPTPGFSTELVILQGEDISDPDADPPTSEYAQPMSVVAADINGDCATVTAGTPCLDVIAAIRVATEDVDDRVSWFKNLGGDPPTFEEFVISTNLEGPNAVYAADLDSDGWMDVLVASTDDNRITWFRNLKGEEDPPTTDPPEWEEIGVSTIALGAMWVSVDDLDGDCVQGVQSYCKEVLSASSADNLIAWYEVDEPVEPGPPAEPIGSPGSAGAPGATTGVPPTEPTLWVDTDALLFGEVFAGQVEPATLPLTIKNIATSGDDLRITSITSTTGNFGPSETTLTLPPDTSQEISVIFVPTAVEFFEGTLEFTSSNAVNDPLPTVELTGTGLQFVEHVVTTDRLFARFVSTGDVDNDGRIDILAASSGDGVIAAYLQQEPDPDAEDPEELIFQELIIAPSANDAREAYVTDLNADGVADVATAFFFEISWHQGGIQETCNSFDVDGDGRMAGAELGWIWTSFGEMVPDPENNPFWWRAVDFNEDGLIDGDDLAIGTSLGVWTRFVSPQEGDPEGPLCNYECVSQD